MKYKADLGVVSCIVDLRCWPQIPLSVRLYGSLDPRLNTCCQHAFVIKPANVFSIVTVNLLQTMAMAIHISMVHSTCILCTRYVHVHCTSIICTLYIHCTLYITHSCMTSAYIVYVYICQQSFVQGTSQWLHWLLYLRFINP